MAEAPEVVPTHPIAKRTNGDGQYIKPHVDEKMYAEMYKRSIDDPASFWDKVRSSSYLRRVYGGALVELR